MFSSWEQVNFDVEGEGRPSSPRLSSCLPTASTACGALWLLRAQHGSTLHANSTCFLAACGASVVPLAAETRITWREAKKTTGHTSASKDSSWNIITALKPLTIYGSQSQVQLDHIGILTLSHTNLTWKPAATNSKITNLTWKPAATNSKISGLRVKSALVAGSAISMRNTR